MRRHLMLWALMILLLYVFLEGASLATLTLLDRWRHVSYQPAPPATGPLYADIHRRSGLRMLSPTLGWTNRPGAVVDLRMEGKAVINGQGIRSHRLYATTPAPCTIRIAAFGDSFTYGSEIANDETWASVLERSAPDTEVLNFGVGGYGVDQALLRYRQDGRAYHPQIVLLGFITDDAERNLHDVRFSVTKPVFTLNDGHLSLATSPRGPPGRIWREVNDGSYEAGPMDVLPSVRLVKVVRSNFGRKSQENDRPADPVALTTSLFNAFASDVRAQSATPVVVFLPTAEDIAQYKETGKTSYDPYMRNMQDGNTVVIDAMGAFTDVLATYTREQYFGILHYNAAAAARVGTHVRSELEQQGLLALPPDCAAATLSAYAP